MMLNFPDTADSSLFAVAKMTDGTVTSTILPASTSQSLFKAPKISRENGFGDFVFGRMLSHERSLQDCMNPRKYHYARAELVISPQGHFFTDTALLIRSNNAPIVELNEFQRYIFARPNLVGVFVDFVSRSGTFPYFKLPVEIKSKIMRILLRPYYKDHSETGKEIISFYVGNDESLHTLKPMFSQGLEHYVKTAESYLRDYRCGNIIEHEIYTFAEFKKLPKSQLNHAQMRFEMVKKHFNLHRSSHPDRMGTYELMLNSENKDIWAYRGVQSADWPMIRLARDLSNVSPRFRQELGEFLWKRTELIVDFEHDHESDVLAPMTFFLERPLIIKGIKTLSIPLHSAQFVDERGLALGTPFKTFCQYVCDVMELEHLRLDISVSSDEVEDLANRRGIFEGLEIIRQVKVSKSFKIELRNHDYGDLDFGRLPELHKSLIDFLLPDTLRNLEPVTTAGDKKSEYLAKRLLEDGA